MSAPFDARTSVLVRMAEGGRGARFVDEALPPAAWRSRRRLVPARQMIDQPASHDHHVQHRATGKPFCSSRTAQPLDSPCRERDENNAEQAERVFEHAIAPDYKDVRRDQNPPISTQRGDLALGTTTRAVVSPELPISL